jgi:protein gp37
VADGSSIEWTQATWNPTTGCDKVSAGCDHCYALTLSKRLKAMGAEKYQNDGDPRTSGPGFGMTVHPDALTLPYTWRTPRLVFVNSMSGLFHARVPVAFIRQVFQVMQETPAAHLPGADEAVAPTAPRRPRLAGERVDGRLRRGRTGARPSR